MTGAASSGAADSAGNGKPDATSDQDHVVTGSPSLKEWSLHVIDHALGDHKQSSSEVHLYVSSFTPSYTSFVTGFCPETHQHFAFPNARRLN